MNDQDAEKPLVFATEESEVEKRPSREAPWKILIVDDEEQVHKVTKVALTDFTFDNRPLYFVDAYSGRQSVEFMREHPDVALILMDVVMEHASAGLDAVHEIRNSLGNRNVRIVVRTGQAGVAPERDVVTRYDINDYKEKTEMTARKLWTTVQTNLRSYHQIIRAEKDAEFRRDGLNAAASVPSTNTPIPPIRRRQPEHPANRLLQALAFMAGIRKDANPQMYGGILARAMPDSRADVLTGTGRCEFDPEAISMTPAIGRLRVALAAIPPGEKWTGDTHFIVVRFEGGQTDSWVMYLESEDPLNLPDKQVFDLFYDEVALVINCVRRYQEVEMSQREFILVLSEAILARFQNTGGQVRPEA